MEPDITVWPCGCIEVYNGGFTKSVYGTSKCARDPANCDELKNFWNGKVPDFEIRLAGEMYPPQ